MQKKRRTMLFVPGNNASLFKDVISYKPDTVMFDLEDSIHINQKDAARQLTQKMIDFFEYEQYQIETAVRINHWTTNFYEKDLDLIVKSKVNIIRLPKVETKQEVLKVISDIEKIEKNINRSKKIILFCALESAKGVLNAYEIATADERVVGIALGGVDYLFDLKATKTKNREEIFFARNMIVHAARAAKIDAFDCIYNDIVDSVGLEKETEFIKNLGFSGKSAIHPAQLPIIKKVFLPKETEIQNALDILKAYEQHLKNEKGVFAINGQMIDKPFLEHCCNLLKEVDIEIPNNLDQNIFLKEAK